MIKITTGQADSSRYFSIGYSSVTVVIFSWAISKGWEILLFGLFLLFQEFVGDFDVFEFDGAFGAKNGLFVAFAENENEVALLGFIES